MPEARTGVIPSTHRIVSPTSYSIRSIELTNHRGEVVNIEAIVADFTIQESLYSPTLVLKMNFKDSANFIEQYELCGQEIIDISLMREPGNDKGSFSDREPFSHRFYVTEYPLFARPQEHVQVFSLMAVSEHAFISNLKFISRAVSGNVSDIIRSILVNDLKVDDNSIYFPWDVPGIGDHRCVSSFTGIIPYMNPLSAVEWLRTGMNDSSLSPFFFWESLRGINIISQTNLTTSKLYRTYYDHRINLQRAHSEDDYLLQACTISSIASNLKMSKMFQAKDGAFGSVVDFVDISEKKVIRQNFAYNSEFKGMPSLEKYPSISDKFKIDGKSLSELESNRSTLPLSSHNYAGKNFESLQLLSYLPCKSFSENLESITHDMKVPGDFDLNPGKRINLQIPKPIDTAYITDGASKYDQVASGNYLVTSVIHEFSSTYYCTVRIKKDALSFDLNK
jgi:hypothetical protein